MNDPSLNIATVERDTGLSKDVLRVWERRYGFPSPSRDQHGERVYSAEQVARLRQVKHLMDQGHRPGKLLALPAEALSALLPRRQHEATTFSPVATDDLDALLALIKQNDGPGYQQAMQQRLARQGLLNFVQYTVAPLTFRVGQSWEEGSIEVFEEHLFTELTNRLLRQAIASLPVGRHGPRIVLTSVPDEPHILGLLMAETLFTLEGAECISLGAQMPLIEIARAASAHRTDIVALSFSAAFPIRQIPGLLQQLLTLLPPTVALWVGGRATERLTRTDGFLRLLTLDDAVEAIGNWRTAHA